MGEFSSGDRPARTAARVLKSPPPKSVLADRRLRRRSRARTGARTLPTLLLTALLGLGLLAVPSSATEYPEHPNFPGQGLPDVGATASGGQYIGPQTVSVTYADAANQWIRTPTLQAVAFNRPATTLRDGTCTQIPEPTGAQTQAQSHASVTFVNTAAGADDTDRFGQTQSFEVHTVAFGSIPVVATVALEQPRSAGSVVVPAELTTRHGIYCAGRGPYSERPPGAPSSNTYFLPSELSGEVVVRIDTVRIDGVEMTMTGSCLAAGGQLDLTSTLWHHWDPDLPDDAPVAGTGFEGNMEKFMSTRLYSIAQGGLLWGELDIPTFRGCLTTEGEDLSGLLTAMVSGSGNYLEVRTEGLDATGSGGTNSCPFTFNCENRLSTVPLPTGIPEPLP